MKLHGKSWLFPLALAATLALGATTAGQVLADEPTVKPEIQQRLEAMREKADQLDEDGKHEDADRIREEFKRYMAKLNGGLEQGRQHADQLDSEGKHEEADRIRQEIKKYAAKLSSGADSSSMISYGFFRSQLDKGNIVKVEFNQQQIVGKFRKAPEIPPQPDAESTDKTATNSKTPSEIYHQEFKVTLPPAEMDNPALVKEMYDKGVIVTAVAQGDKQEAKQLYAKYYPRRGDGSGERRPSELSSASPGEIAAKLEHLRAAVENLRAAGFDSEANHIRELAERLQRYSHGDSEATKSSSSKTPSTAVRTVAFGEQNLRDLGSKDGRVLTKSDFLASAKARGKDVSKAEGSWNSLTGDKDSITLDEFQQKIGAARQKADEKRSNP